MPSIRQSFRNSSAISPSSEREKKILKTRQRRERLRARCSWLRSVVKGLDYCARAREPSKCRARRAGKEERKITPDGEDEACNIYIRRLVRSLTSRGRAHTGIRECWRWPGRGFSGSCRVVRPVVVDAEISDDTCEFCVNITCSGACRGRERGLRFLALATARSHRPVLFEILLFFL